MHAVKRFAPTTLMLGNIVTGCSVMAPAGMLHELSEDLGVSIATAGLLITFGAIVLCVGSPVTAWLTSRIERRTLLTVTLLVLAFTNAASAFAPDYTSLLVLRLIMLAVGALYTPQAAGTAALIVPEQKRGSTIAYIFLGWSLAAAVGLPLITLIASRYGWRTAHGGIGVRHAAGAQGLGEFGIRRAAPLRQPLLQALPHLAGRLAGEGDRQDLVRLRAGQQRAHDARHQHPGLAGAGTGLDGDVPARVAGNGVELLARDRAAVVFVGRLHRHAARLTHSRSPCGTGRGRHRTRTPGLRQARAAAPRR